jgi:hypothetical protein
MQHDQPLHSEVLCDSKEHSPQQLQKFTYSIQHYLQQCPVKLLKAGHAAGGRLLD